MALNSLAPSRMLCAQWPTKSVSCFLCFPAPLVIASNLRWSLTSRSIRGFCNATAAKTLARKAKVNTIPGNLSTENNVEEILKMGKRNLHAIVWHFVRAMSSCVRDVQLWVRFCLNCFWFAAFDCSESDWLSCDDQSVARRWRQRHARRLVSSSIKLLDELALKFASLLTTGSCAVAYSLGFVFRDTCFEHSS